MKIQFATLFTAGAIAALSITMFTGCAVTSGRSTVGQYTDDKTITAKVKTALTQDSTVKAHQVNVTTFNGEVQLSGFVDSQAQKDRATEVVRNIAGVKTLHNNLVVSTGRSSGDAGVKGEVEVKADDGKVEGKVDVDKK